MQNIYRKRTRLIVYALLATLILTGCDTLDPAEPGNLVPKTVVEDSSLPSITLNDIQFHAETFGNPENPVFIFLHGGPGGDYRSLLRLKERYNDFSLLDDYYLVFWDQRGAGLSERVESSLLHQESYVDDLLALINKYSPNQPVRLVGHSWGGMYATLFVNHHPTRVSQAVLIEPGPLTGELFEEIKNDYIDLDFFAEWLNDFTWNENLFSPDDDARQDFQMLLGYKDSQPKYHQELDVDPAPFWRMGAAASRYVVESGMDDNGTFVYDFTDNLTGFQPEVLFIASENNEVIGEEFQKRQTAFYPQATLRVIPNSGHDCQWTKPAETVALIKEYFGQ